MAAHPAMPVTQLVLGGQTLRERGWCTRHFTNTEWPLPHWGEQNRFALLPLVGRPDVSESVWIQVMSTGLLECATEDQGWLGRGRMGVLNVHCPWPVTAEGTAESTRAGGPQEVDRLHP